MKPGGNTCSEQTPTALSTFAPVRSPEPSLCVVGVVPGTDGCRLATGSGVPRTGSGSGMPAGREETVGSCGTLTRNAQLPVTVDAGMVACVHRSLDLVQGTTFSYEAQTTDATDCRGLQAPDILQAPRGGTRELVATGSHGLHQRAGDVATDAAMAGQAPLNGILISGDASQACHDARDVDQGGGQPGRQTLDCTQDVQLVDALARLPRSIRNALVGDCDEQIRARAMVRSMHWPQRPLRMPTLARLDGALVYDVRGCDVNKYLVSERATLPLCSLDSTWGDRLSSSLSFFVPEPQRELTAAELATRILVEEGVWTVCCESARRPGTVPVGHSLAERRSGWVSGSPHHPVASQSCQTCWDLVADEESMAATKITRWWRSLRGSVSHGDDYMPCSTEMWWDRRRTRSMGPIQAHARFLQFLYRTHRQRSGWQRGCLPRGERLVPPPVHRCRGGEALASDSAFQKQKRPCRGHVAMV